MKDYNIGYVAGMFDLFHIGHLNLIRESRGKCEYLVVGVLTDKLVVHFRGKEPCISLKGRLEVIGVLKCMDKTVGVTMDNTDKMAAWELYKFNCLFSGDNYMNNEPWTIDKKRLNQVGADIHFSPYTKNTGSTQIKEAMGRK